MVSLAKNYDSFIFSTSGLIIPLSLISGTYFSLQDIPVFFKWLAYLFPLSHATEMTRGFIYHQFEMKYLIQFCWMGIIFFALYKLTSKLFYNKLIQ
jgi:lipooligosaccharide transport system permease protein